MKKTSKYESLYRKNKDTGRIIIDIALDNYLEFFNEWDNSAIRKRDIHAGLVEFLDLCSEDIPLRKKLEIAFSLNTTKLNSENEEFIRISYRNYYNSIIRLNKRKTKAYIRSSIILLFISLTLLTIYGLVIDSKDSTIVSRVSLESLLIGGWVFAWEAVHLLFIDIIGPIRQRRELNRLLEADISFIYLSE